MDPLLLCWVVEYACLKKQDSVIQALFHSFEELRKNTTSPEDSPHYQCLFNSRARLLLRALERKMEEEENPLITEQDLRIVAELFYEYGSPLHPLDRTAKFTVYLERQGYLHYVHQLLTTEDLNQEEELYQSIMNHHKVMKKRYRARKRTADRTEYPDGDANLVEFARALAPLERQLYKEYEDVLPLHGSDNHRWHQELSALVKRWPVDSFKEEMMHVLDDLESRLPPTVLESIQTVWKKEYANGVDQETLEQAIRTIHDSSQTERVLPSSSPSPPRARSPSKSPPLRSPLPSPSPASPPPASPQQGEESPESALLTQTDLLESSPEPHSQPSTQDLYNTPVVATELRTSLQQLARLQGSDPINRAHEEGKAARKRSRPQPAAIPPRKRSKSRSRANSPHSREKEDPKRFVVLWNSDSDEDEDDIREYVPDFRDPAPPPRPLPTQTPATATSANPSATNNNTNNILPRRGRRPNRKWSGHEVRWLVAGIREFGAGNWASILSRYPFEGRTGVDLKDKFRNLLKYGTEEEIIRQHS